MVFATQRGAKTYKYNRLLANTGRVPLLILLAALWTVPLFPQSAPRAFWRNLPPALTVGEEAVLVLCVDRGTRPDPPAQGFSLPPVPAMAIMEALEPEAENELLALRVIPLEGPVFALPPFSFPLGNLSLRVPALRIPVRPAPPGGPPPAAPPEEAPEQTGYPPFPSGFTPRSGMFAGPSREIQARGQTLWEEGRIVEALAELRRNERDHPAGFSLVELRRALERTLGLEGEPDEVYSPRLFFIPALVLCLILAALSLTLPAGLSRKRSSRTLLWFRRGLCLFFSAAALFCLFRLSFGRRLSLNYGNNPPRQALSRESAVYRVPDDRGTEIARFREGQGLLVYEIRDGWAYAELSANGRAGWIKTGTYLIY